MTNSRPITAALAREAQKVAARSNDRHDAALQAALVALRQARRSKNQARIEAAQAQVDRATAARRDASAVNAKAGRIVKAAR